MTDKDFGLPANLTAANFGKVDDLATRGDLAAGLLNMVFETAAMIARFAARSCGTQDIVLTGNLTTIPQCEPKFRELKGIFSENYIIPENSQYATVIGAALLAFME
jgi:type II pantothenate kinase